MTAATSLKDQNAVGLWALMVANLGVCYAVLTHGALDTFEFSKVIPAGVGLLLTGIVNAQLPPEMKARIVFARWNNPLPGCEAFSRHAATDARVDMESLRRAHGPLPDAPRDQNTLWYKLYRTIKNEPEVRSAHRAFLFARDYACISLLLAPVLASAAWLQAKSAPLNLLYTCGLVLQFMASSQAARNNGKRLVTTVLAMKASELSELKQ